MGRQRRSVTEYEYDDPPDDGHIPRRGRLVRAVTVHDPRFDDDDTLGLLERAEDRALACGGCGHPRDEVYPRDPEHAKQLDRELHAELLTCASCGKQETALKQLDNPAPGTKVIVRRD